MITKTKLYKKLPVIILATILSINIYSCSNTTDVNTQPTQTLNTNNTSHQENNETSINTNNTATTFQKNALKTAENYANNLNMSKDAVYNQLISDFEGFTPEDAQYAIDNLK